MLVAVERRKEKVDTKSLNVPNLAAINQEHGRSRFSRFLYSMSAVRLQKRFIFLNNRHIICSNPTSNHYTGVKEPPVLGLVLSISAQSCRNYRGRPGSESPCTSEANIQWDVPLFWNWVKTLCCLARKQRRNCLIPQEKQPSPLQQQRHDSNACCSLRPEHTRRAVQGQ